MSRDVESISTSCNNITATLNKLLVNVLQEKLQGGGGRGRRGGVTLGKVSCNLSCNGATTLPDKLQEKLLSETWPWSDLLFLTTLRTANVVYNRQTCNRNIVKVKACMELKSV